MSKETAEEWLAVFMDRYGFWGARHELELMLQAAAHEEREKLLAELRSEKAEAVYNEAWIGLVGTYPHLGVAFAEGKKALAIAKQEGMEKERNARQLDYADGFEEGRRKAKAELQEIQSLIHRHAHTTVCAVHQSKTCDCMEIG